MKLLLNYWRETIILTIIFLAAVACARNPANQLARELYPQFSHLSAPEHNFEQLWHLFDQHYAFFDLKGVNWDSIYQQYRPLITTKTTEDSLLHYFAAMLNPLQDGHVRLTRADTNVIELDRRPCQFARTFRGRLGDFQKNTFKVLGQNGFAEMQHEIPIPGYAALGFDYLYSYTQSSNLGYLRIVDCRNELATFDQILTEFGDTKGLIIDLRYNLGGEVGKEMAARFLSAPKVYGYLKVKKPTGFTEPTPLEQKPAGRQYTQPIVVLINDATFSAAEEFVLVLATESHVKLIGSSTGGYLSDAFTYRLPNGIVASLSNQQYLDLNYQTLEDKGIQPVKTLTNSLEELEVGKDAILHRAIQLLKNGSDQ